MSIVAPESPEGNFTSPAASNVPKEINMRKALLLVVTFCAACTAVGQTQTDRQPLQFRKAVNHNLRSEDEGIAVPGQAVRVFAHESTPESVLVHADSIAVDYGQSGVLFDRQTGQVLRRLTVADGYIKRRPKEFPAPPDRRQGHLVGPGVLENWVDSMPRRAPLRAGPPPASIPGGTPPPSDDPGHAPVASVKFGGQIWEAMQPKGFFQNLHERVGGYGELQKNFGTWTSVLDVANAESFLQNRPEDGIGKGVRYTMKEGLASNLVTHLAAADGRLWAACVDIYDPARQDWGAGGLSCFDPKTEKWSRVDKIKGRPVRWVTLLQTVGEDLWAGFREGSGVVDDKVAYGMGLYPGQYRPVATAIVLARLSKGKWTVFSRLPLDAPGQVHASTTVPTAPAATAAAAEKSPRETPRNLAVVGAKVFLFSQSQARMSGNWDTTWAGHLSLLDLASGQWRAFDTEKDLAAYELCRMVAEGGELLALTDQGVRRWVDKDAKWASLDPQSPLVNPSISAVVPVGKELWIGYTNQSFGVIGRQGISRFDEEKMTWSYTDPKEIGTACPVMAIVPIGQEVLVLFRQRHWTGSAMEYHFYNEPRGPAGLGRFAAGKWEFPIHLDGVPESITRTRKGPNGEEKWEEKLEPLDLIPAGGKVFVSNAAGVFEGPCKWRQVLASDNQPHEPPLLRPSADGRTIDVLQRDKRLTYDPASGKTTEAAVSSNEYNNAWWNPERAGDGRLRQNWTEVPTKKEGSWALGEIDGDDHRVAETPWAVWIVSTGQLIRLDRKILAAWLGEPPK